MVLAPAVATGEEEERRVCRAQAGDRDALTELVATHGRDVERVALRILRDADDAQDAAQDAWIRVTANLTSLRDPRRFQPWLRSITRNTSLDFIRRRGRHGHSGCDEELLGAVADTAGATPEQSVLSWDVQHEVWETLGRLSAADRAILHLWAHDGLDYAEIAQRLGIAHHSAEVRVSRARERFRAQYGAAEADERCGAVSALELSALVEGSLDEGTRDRVQSHLSACAGCRERLAAIGDGRRLYRAFGPFLLPTGGGVGLVAHVQALIAKVASLAGIGGGASAATGAAGTAGTAAAASTAAATSAAAAGTVVASSTAAVAAVAAVATGGFAISTAAASGIAAVVLLAAATAGAVAPGVLAGHDADAGAGAEIAAFTVPAAPGLSATAVGYVPDPPAQPAPLALSRDRAGGVRATRASAFVLEAATSTREATIGDRSGNGNAAGGVAGGLTASAAVQAASDAESARQQAESDEESARQQAESDEESARQQAESDEESARQQAESDEESARQQAESDEESARQQAESDEESARQQAESDEESARQQAESDEESARQQAESDEESARQQAESDAESAQQQAASDAGSGNF